MSDSFIEYSGVPADRFALWEEILKDGFLTPDTPFISKPFTPELLLRKVREVLDLKPGKSLP